MASPLLPVRLAARPIDLVACLVPPGLVVAFFLTYLASPSSYLKYVINFKQRELQAVEIITFTSAFAAAFILFGCAVVEWLNVRRAGGSIIPGGALLIGVVGLAALFMGGEEISWGQTFFKWKTPEAMTNVSRETNLHNGHLGMSVHSLGNIFIGCAFVLLPIAWAWRRSFIKLPDDWRAGIAEWPVATTTLIAMCVRLPKEVYLHRVADTARTASAFYRDYLEEIGEQKEMLIALAMLVYAIYRIAAVLRTKAMPSTIPADPKERARAAAG